MTIYRCGVFSRRPGMTEQDFRRHWQTTHAELASKLPALGSYRQNHILERYHEDSASSVQPIDGISQLAFPTVKHMEVSDQSAEYEACKLDIPKFQGSITILVLEAEDFVLRSDATAAVKLVGVSARRSQAEVKDFRKRWWDQSRDTVADIPGIVRFVQNFVIDRSHPVSAGVPSGDASAVEALCELWFEDEATAQKAVHSAAFKRLMFDDALLVPVGIYRVEEMSIV